LLILKNTLDLNGSISYTNNPVILYGENITGKSNIINML